MGRTRFSKDINQFQLKSFVNSLSFIPIKRRPLCLIMLLPWLHLQIICSFSELEFPKQLQVQVPVHYFQLISSSSEILIENNFDRT